MLENVPHIDETRRSATRGVEIGILCGLVFGFAATVGAVLVGYGPWMPLRLAASVVIGEDALTTGGAGVFVLGLIVHFAVSVYYGLLFGLTHDRFIHVHWMRNSHRLVLGLIFGLVVWAINLQIIARILYPWFFYFRQDILAVVHVVLYGLPLAFMYIERDRRRVPRQEPHHA